MCLVEPESFETLALTILPEIIVCLLLKKENENNLLSGIADCVWQINPIKMSENYIR